MGSSNSYTPTPRRIVVQPGTAPAPDPALVAQQQQAALLQQQSVQQNVSTDTQNLLRQFGAQSAMAASGLTTPLSSITGGFATPAVNASGNMVGAR